MQDRDSTNSEALSRGSWLAGYHDDFMVKCKEETEFPTKEQKMKSSSWLCLETRIVQRYSGTFNMPNMIAAGTDSPETKKEIKLLFFRNSMCSCCLLCVCHSGISYFSKWVVKYVFPRGEWIDEACAITYYKTTTSAVGAPQGSKEYWIWLHLGSNALKTKALGVLYGGSSFFICVWGW